MLPDGVGEVTLRTTLPEVIRFLLQLSQYLRLNAAYSTRPGDTPVTGPPYGVPSLPVLHNSAQSDRETARPHGTLL